MMTAPTELARSVLEAAPDAMIVIDGTGIIRYANRQTSVLFGFVHDEIIGRSVESLMPCLLYTSPSPRDYAASRMPSSA